MLTHINTYVIIPNKSTAISVKKRFCAVLFPAKIYRPATHPINFAADSPDKIHRCAAWAVFFFSGKLNLESFISRLNVISCHDLTLSVGEPDNAAAKQGQELRSEQTVTPLHEQHHLYLFLRLNNSETFVES